ncbi:MAG: cell division protein FtsK [Gammaproteobacteria bacterium]|nr:MAG: cell division protein FtsK [Gammaproteobacteria bacterium]
MSQASKTTTIIETDGYHIAKGLREAALLLCVAAALFTVLAMFSYDHCDPAWSHSGCREQPLNLGGPAGAWLADLSYYLFGGLALVLPALLAWFGWWLYSSSKGKGIILSYQRLGFKTVGMLFTVAGGCGLATLHFAVGQGLPEGPGGVLGMEMVDFWVARFGTIGGTLFLLVLFLSGITWLTGLSWLWLSEVVGARTLLGIDRLMILLRRREDASEGNKARDRRQEKAIAREIKIESRQPVRIEPVIQSPPVSDRVQEEKQIEMFEVSGDYALPALSLLDDATPSGHQLSDKALKALSDRVEIKLEEFGVDVSVVAVIPGPVVTRFELEPAPGVKASKITNLSTDLARALSVNSVRVIEVLPGKSTVGIEIPNEQREMVRLSEVLRSQVFDQSDSVLTLALGKDIQGLVSVADVGKMPHLLVSGTTGSGKSVAINAMILSLLYKATPEQVRMIMIDPKMLELSVYDGIPHLLTPVVTDMDEAFGSLQWAVFEMDKRYRLMSALGVRNIAGYNRKVREAAAKGEPIPDPYPPPTPPPLVIDEEPAEQEVVYCVELPFIVIIVDELADMMMLVGKKVEQLIARLAQKARASGIHLILATQRPSVDVITGLIKANIPTRIAFQVSSKIDSRTILDQSGAEALLGHGDMLYLAPGTSFLERVHGAFVSDGEVHEVVKALKAQGKPNYIEAITQGAPDQSGFDPMDGSVEGAPEDELYDQAIFLVTSSGRASISSVQRHLRVGYNRAARLVEEMERQGIVGPLKSNGQREVLAEPPPEI